MGFS
ncbi:TOBE domain protein, partial [Vibrio parahaemolyticus V-223/04]|jgi:hypothetical protein